MVKKLVIWFALGDLGGYFESVGYRTVIVSDFDIGGCILLLKVYILYIYYFFFPTMTTIFT